MPKEAHGVAWHNTYKNSRRCPRHFTETAACADKTGPMLAMMRMMNTKTTATTIINDDDNSEECARGITQILLTPMPLLQHNNSNELDLRHAARSVGRHGARNEWERYDC